MAKSQEGQSLNTMDSNSVLLKYIFAFIVTKLIINVITYGFNSVRCFGFIQAYYSKFTINTKIL